jgi:hypothetical protein
VRGDLFYFLLFGNVGVPLMATLYIPRLNVGLPVWLGIIPNVTNSLDASQLSTLCHGNHFYVPSSTNYSPPPCTFFGESLATSNRKSKLNRKRNNRKKKSPTFVSHVGDRSSTSAIHVEDQHPSSTSHARGKKLTSSSHVEELSTTSVSHIGGKAPILCKS